MFGVVRRHTFGFAKFSMVGIWVAFSGSIFWIALGSDRPPETDLIAVLVITIAAVIIGSLATTVVYHLIGQANPQARPEVVFRESIKRYAWLAAPIASGYGVSQVVIRVFEMITGVQP